MTTTVLTIVALLLPIIAATPAWSQWTLNSCGDCHHYPPLDGTARNVPAGAVIGSHQKHANTTTGYGFACSVCHVAPATITSADFKHRNGMIEMQSTFPTYSGNYSKPVSFAQTNNPVMGTCSTTYCHSSGNTARGGSVAYITTPIWGGAAQCDDCHGNQAGKSHPVYATGGAAAATANSHVKHVEVYAYGCNKCHSTTTTDSAIPPTTVIAGGAHLNSAETVSFTSFSGKTGTYNLGTAACSATYCHGSGTAIWGDTTINCASCHEASSALAARHDRHYNGASLPTSINTTSAHTASAYVYGCGTCHPSDQHVQGPADGTGPILQDAQIATGASPTKIQTFTQGGSSTTDTRGYNYTVGSTCTTVCHSRDGAGAAPVTAANWGGAYTGGCAVCHRAGGDTLATMAAYTNGLTSQHNQHIASDAYGANSIFSCNTCHSGTASNSTTINGASGRDQHPDTVKNVAFNATVSGTWSGTQCSNTYCHSNGTISAASATHAAMNWSGGSKTCEDCHYGNAAATNKMATNNHGAHINDTANKVGRNVGCANCHSATASNDTTIGDKTVHVNTNVNVRFNNASDTSLNADSPTYNGSDARSTVSGGASKAAGSTVGSCSMVYCHSIGNLSDATGSGTVVTAGSASFRTIAWNASAIACDGCHGDQAGKAYPIYATGSAASTTANSHVKHVEGSGLSCDYCHNTTTVSTTITAATMTVIPGGQHLDRTEDVSFKTNGGQTGVYNAGKTCSATYCHGGGNPTWGGAALGCNACHQSQGSDGTASYSGKHQKHVDAAGYDFSCETCHAVASTIHAGGPATGTNPGGGAVGAYQTTEIRYTALSAGTMSTGQSYRGSTTTYKFQSISSNPFGAAATVAYSSGTTTGVDALNSAITYYANGTCNQIWCHSNANPNAGVNSYAAPTWGATMNCGSCHSKADDVSPTWSAPHTKHITSYSGRADFTCAACHMSTATDNSTLVATTPTTSHVNGAKDLKFSTFANASATGSAASHQCSNVYCHGDGTTQTPAVTVTWSGTLDCAGCHKNTAALLTSGSHSFHLQYAAITCDDCHAATASSNNALSASTGTANHVNKAVTIQFNAASANNLATYNSVSSGGTYSYQKGIASAKATCNSTFCHGSNSGTWGVNTGNATCVKCHGVVNTTTASYNADPNQAAPGYSTGTATGIDTNGDNLPSDNQVGAHSAHLTTSAYRGPIPCSSCHVVPSAVGDAGHIDSSLPAELTFSGLSSTYHSVSAPSPTYNYSTRTCSTNYCHDGAYIKNGSSWSNGTGTAPVWTNTAYLNVTPTAADCGKCHGYPPGGSHDNPAANCSGCHNNVRSSDNLGFTAGGLSQHMDGQLLGGGDACIDCHGGIMTSGMHSKHTTTTVLAGRSLTLSSYGVGSWWYSYNYTNGVADASCGFCHPDTVTTHRNGTRNLDFKTSTTNTWYLGTVREKNAANSFTQNPGLSVTCSSVYCHSNGYGSYVYATTPDWYGGSFSGDKCQACHGNWPNDAGQKAGSPAHTGHAVGIHFDDIYTGTTGTMATGTGDANSHGNTLYSTTINCNLCHNGTVTVSTNMNATQCISCHSAGANAIAMTISTTSTLHVNGAVDVAFSAVAVKSKAQLRNDITTVAELNNSWTRTVGYKVAGAYDAAKNALNTGTMWNGGTKTCSNIACHNGNAVQWNGTISCGGCHTQLP